MAKKREKINVFEKNDLTEQAFMDNIYIYEAKVTATVENRYKIR